MDIREIAAGYSVSGQIQVSDIPAIAAAGFKTIICNRPDNESPDQPAYQLIKDAAGKAGLTFAYVPVISGATSLANTDEMRKVLASAPKPVLAYCRSGARSTTLYALAKAP